MAKLKGLPAYTGTIGELSAYRMEGVEGIILRQKGGPTKEQVRKSASFDLTRRLNAEFTGRMQMVTQISLAMKGVRHLYHGNCSGKMGAVLKKIQEADNTGELGKRSVLLSRAGYWLEGFTLNKYHPFDTVLKHPLDIALSKVEGRATISWPVLIPGLHITNPKQQPLYRLVFTLGVVADMVYNDSWKKYQPVTEVNGGPAIIATPWYTAAENCPAQTIELQLPNYTTMPGQSLILSGGIEYGQPQSGGYIQYTKYAGSGKVLRVG